MPLSPVRFLLENVKNILSINTQSFKDAVQEVSSTSNSKCLITIKSDLHTSIRKLGAHWIIGTKHIEINECLFCALWASSYFVANAYVSLCDYLNDKNDELPIENDSIELLKYAKSLVPFFNEWPEGLPVPQDFKDDKYAKIANLIMPIAADVIICHEFAHMYLGHKTKALQHEIDADNLAVNWVCPEKEKYPVKELAIMTSFITMVLLDSTPYRDKTDHPASLTRMENYLNNLSIGDNDVLWGLAILTIKAWEKEFEEVEFSFPKKDNLRENYESFVASINQ